jgi:predicted TPR repeat methyltransferase
LSAMTAAAFEERYRRQVDPWGYRSRSYEREKYAGTLAACGPGPFDHALELGGSIGVFSAALAPRCRRLLTLDFSPTAVAAARRALADHPHARATLGEIPRELPPGPFDLVVASEILYYLTAADLSLTLSALRDRVARGGRLVCVHWRPPGPERPQDAASVHAAVRQLPWLTPIESVGNREYLLDVLVRR